MNTPELWVRFLGDRTVNEARPRLCLDGSDGEIELVIKPRDRIFIAALAVPRAMASQADGEGWELPVLSSEEICDRTVSDRSIIGRALGDLERIFSQQGLRLDDYVFANKGDSQYGLRGVRVDVVELLAARDAPDDADRLLSQITDRPASAGLTQANQRLFNATTLMELDAILQQAQQRSKNAAASGGGSAAAESSHQELDEVHGSAPASVSLGPAAVDGPSAALRDNWHPRRVPGWAIAFGGAIALGVVVAVVIAIVGGSGGSDQAGVDPAPVAPGRFEITGGAARTWSNYNNAGGKPGRSLKKYQHVYVTCRVRGFQAGGTNVWWYRLGEPPWSNRFYASADAFYNNGHTRGPLKGTPKIDAGVPLCP